MNKIEVLGDKLVSLQAEEYRHLADEIKKIIKAIKDSGREIHGELSSPLLFTNLNIGLSFIWRREGISTIQTIGPGPVGTVHFVFTDGGECYIFEDEIKELI
ncbi:MAG: hypothetical protein ACKKL6_03545 [Candidatus Komeilibacteria bacterium]